MSTQREILRNLTKANSPNRSGSNKDQTSNLNFQFPQSIKPKKPLGVNEKHFFYYHYPKTTRWFLKNEGWYPFGKHKGGF